MIKNVELGRIFQLIKRLGLMSSVNTSYKTVSWNIGGITDFIGLCRRAKLPSGDNLSQTSSLRNQRLEQAFKSIFENQKPDLIFLQEVGTISTSLKNWLPNYRFCYDGDDTLVAWNSERLTEIEGSRQSQQLCNRYSIVDLQDTTTKKTVRVASAHLHGFDLARPERERCGHKVTKSGDDELREITKLLLDRKIRNPDAILIGMDANSTPDIHPERITILEDHGFKRDFSDNSVTAFNPTLPGREAKIDFIYGTCLEGTIKVVAGDANPDLQIESPETNPSDHRPLCKIVVYE